MQARSVNIRFTSQVPQRISTLNSITWVDGEGGYQHLLSSFTIEIIKRIIPFNINMRVNREGSYHDLLSSFTIEIIKRIIPFNITMGVNREGSYQDLLSSFTIEIIKRIIQLNIMGSWLSEVTHFFSYPPPSLLIILSVTALSQAVELYPPTWLLCVT